MRYIVPVHFVTEAPGAYDPATGDYDVPTTSEQIRFADVTDAGDKIASFIYGEMKPGSLIVRLQRPYTGSYSYLTIGGRKYHADKTRRVLLGMTIVASEVL